MKTILNIITGSCYVVIANENEKVKECRVFYNYTKAIKVFEICKKMYGASNVCFTSKNIIG